MTPPFHRTLIHKAKKKLSLWLRYITPIYSPPGEISKNGCYTWSDGDWLYIADSIPGVYWQMLSQWKHDSHLAG